MASGLNQGQIDLEKRLGMSIWEIREKILALPNDERWEYMTQNGIGGGLIYLAPSQYPKKPKEAVWIEETPTDGHQITMDEWVGTFEHRLRTPKKKEARDGEKKWRAYIYLKNGAVIEVTYEYSKDDFGNPWTVFRRDGIIVASVLRSEIVAAVYETLPEEEEDGKPVGD